MNLSNFVSNLNLNAFEALQQAVSVKYQEINLELDVVKKYFYSQPVLMKAAKLNFDACVNVTSEKTKVSKDIVERVVYDYLSEPVDENLPTSPPKEDGLKTTIKLSRKKRRRRKRRR